MIDKIFDTWIKLCPEFKTDYGILESSYRLAPFPRTMATVFDTRAHGYCYTYTPSRGDTPTPTIQCPSATANSTATATPTNSLNKTWLQMWIQTLVPGVNNLRIGSDRLEEDTALRAFRRSLPNVEKLGNNSNRTVKHSKPIPLARKSRYGNPDNFVNYHPLPQYCPNANYTIVAPKWDDRKDLRNIRYATVVNASLMQKMGFNMEVYKDTIIFDQLVVDYYNNLPGFISPAALKYVAYNSTD